MIEFDYKLDYTKINFKDKANRKLYRIGRGEQGVLLVRPYTNFICRYWQFKTPLDALNRVIFVCYYSFFELTLLKT